MSLQAERRHKILVLGGHGFVGQEVVKLFSHSQFKIIAPTKSQADISSQKSLKEFLSTCKPDSVINFAGYTNLKEAEAQKRNTGGICYKLNVIGTKNIAMLCKKNNIYFIQISTDGVFPGSTSFPGPYSEGAKYSKSQSQLSWYSITKLKGEKEVIKLKSRAAIVRISYPFGNPKSEKDLVNKTVKYIKFRMPLFTDQEFSPTFIPDMMPVITKLIEQKKIGIYHVACHGITSPYLFGLYIANKLKINPASLTKQTVNDYLKSPKSVPRATHGGILTHWTQKSLNVKFHKWQDAVKKCILKKPNFKNIKKYD